MTRADGTLREHRHAEAVPPEGAVMKPTESLLKTKDRGNQQPRAGTLHLEALKERGKTGQVGRLNQIQGPTRSLSKQFVRLPYVIVVVINYSMELYRCVAVDRILHVFNPLMQH